MDVYRFLKILWAKQDRPLCSHVMRWPKRSLVVKQMQIVTAKCNLPGHFVEVGDIQARAVSENKGPLGHLYITVISSAAEVTMVNPVVKAAS